MLIWILLLSPILISVLVIVMTNKKIRDKLNIWVYDHVSGYLDIRAIKSGDIKLDIELTDHLIRHNYTRPDLTNKAWDENDYSNGNIFIQGYSNSMKHGKIELSDDIPEKIRTQIEEDHEEEYQGNLKPSTLYKTYMNQKIVEDFVSAGQVEKTPFLEKWGPTILLTALIVFTWFLV